MKNYEDWAELAIARLRTFPVDFIFNAGSWEGNSLGLIYEIQHHTAIGEFFVTMEQEYFDSLKNGELQKILNEKE
ncbi:MAG: hypothetical protein NC218_03920 [Acetobacter sp.]|nr:hypothetical protein [Acetobacter sp.]